MKYESTYKNIIKAAINGKGSDVHKNFASVMSQKIIEKIGSMERAVASKLFNGTK